MLLLFSRYLLFSHFSRAKHFFALEMMLRKMFCPKIVQIHCTALVLNFDLDIVVFELDLDIVVY